eukprot:TRINITY_DN53950_c0_g1_i1.p1 TRINITY_DN53950_c0_g1~~TRINITY_DN53950_c0_g1_i1.p1  ORF type:complete len:108 (+),score=18.33 TRINITY_DN53950_c0_g1_i1:67-390(+)
MIRRPPRSTLSSSSAASDVYKRQITGGILLGDGLGKLRYYLGGNLLRFKGRSHPLIVNPLGAFGGHRPWRDDLIGCVGGRLGGAAASMEPSFCNHCLLYTSPSPRDS